MSESPPNAVAHNEAETTTAPQQKEKREHTRNPFEGWRGWLIMVLTPLRYIFNLPGALTIRQAKKIVKTGRGTIYGYDSTIYLYPLIPISVIGSLIVWAFPTPGVELTLGFIYVLALWVILVTIGTDVGHKSVGLWAGIIVATVAVWTVLQLTGTVNVNEGIGRTVRFFGPKFHPGTSLLLSALLGITLAVTFAKSKAHQVITLQGNNFIPARIQGMSTYPTEDYRLTSGITDWLEYILMQSASILLLQTVHFYGQKERDDMRDDAVVVLQNVPCAMIVLRAVQHATERTEVQKRS